MEFKIGLVTPLGKITEIYSYFDNEDGFEEVYHVDFSSYCNVVKKITIQHEGILLPNDLADKLLSAKSRQYGMQYDDFIFFDGNKINVALHDIYLKIISDYTQKIKSCCDINLIELQVRQHREHIDNYFSLLNIERVPPFNLDFFGDYDAPKIFDEKISSGIYNITLFEEKAIAVHKYIAEQNMSDIEVAYGIDYGEYLVYVGKAKSIAISALQNDSVFGLFVDEETSKNIEQEVIDFFPLLANEDYEIQVATIPHINLRSDALINVMWSANDTTSERILEYQNNKSSYEINEFNLRSSSTI